LRDVGQCHYAPGRCFDLNQIVTRAVAWFYYIFVWEGVVKEGVVDFETWWWLLSPWPKYVAVYSSPNMLQSGKWEPNRRNAASGSQ
jgi:hypothetical protein